MRIISRNWSRLISSRCPRSTSRFSTFYWFWPMTAAAFCISMLPPTRPRYGRDSNCGRPFLSPSFRATYCATAILFSALSYGTGARHGHLRSPVGTALAMAASLCRASDWIHSSRVPRSCDRVPRALATKDAQIVFRLLPSLENASFAGKGLAGATSDSAAGRRAA